MATRADIPPDLTDDEKASLFQYLDASLNSEILYALLYGIYTGILAVTLWHIFINKRWRNRRALVVVIILLYTLISINFAVNWPFVYSAFIQNGQSFWTVYSKLIAVDQAAYLEMGITSSMSTILADLYMIWCCWMVWERRWLIVLLPILSLISATVLKITDVYRAYSNGVYGVFDMLYIAFVLATTLWCTLLIIFRILYVTGVRRGAGDRLRVYRRFIGVLVESSALYSIALILYLALFFCSDLGFNYLDAIAGVARGVAPTLLVGRAAAGHTQPTEEHDESSPVSTIRFRTSSQSSQPPQPFTSSFQGSTMQSAVLDMDIEAQTERSDELVVSVVDRQ